MKYFDKNELNELAIILKQDGVISVPTDTIYGICARINSEIAFDKLVTYKKRPANKSFPVMCANIEQIRQIAIVDNRIEKLIKSFMPGPITLVLNKNKDAFINNAGFRSTTELAVRMAPTKILEDLIYKVDSPLFLTSANISGQEPCKNLKEIEMVFPNLDGILDGEALLGTASTIVDCTTDVIKIQRVGPISEEEIMNILES